MNITVSGAAEVLDKMRTLEHGVKQVGNNYAKELCEIGRPVADMGYSTATYSGADPNTTVDVVTDGKNASLVASGIDLLFVEFGTGINTAAHPAQGQIEGIVAHGNYELHKAAHPPWYYTGPPGTGGKFVRISKVDGHIVSKTYGDEPARAMFDASQAMRDEVYRLMERMLYND